MTESTLKKIWISYFLTLKNHGKKYFQRKIKKLKNIFGKKSSIGKGINKLTKNTALLKILFLKEMIQNVR